MSWDYRLARKALNNFKRFPKDSQRQIFAALEEMRVNPFQGDIKPIQGVENLYRRRIGSYRIYFRPFHERKLLDIPEITRKQSR